MAIEKNIRDEKRHDRGVPGEGKGRIDRVERTGIYRASDTLTSPKDVPHTPGGHAKPLEPGMLGQRDRGPDGYNDAGSSEVFHIPPEGMEEDKKPEK